ncbi:MAG: RDD family protein [Aureispira sp.]
MTPDLLDDRSLNVASNRTMATMYSTRKERLGAFVIDVVLVNFVLLILDIFLDTDNVPFAIAIVLVFPFYKILTEGWYGKTLGKLLLDLEVVSAKEGHAPINLLMANRRFIWHWPFYIALILHILIPEEGATNTMNIAVVLFLIGSLLMALLVHSSILREENNRTWCDKLAKTVCIHKIRAKKQQEEHNFTKIDQ